jgi:hypothetical protein
LRVDGLFAGIGGADPWANLTGYSHPQVS